MQFDPSTDLRLRSVARALRDRNVARVVPYPRIRRLIFECNHQSIMRTPHAPTEITVRPPLPLTDAHWQAIVNAIGLSKREALVVELVLRDLSNKEIAEVLGISPRTVETYLHDRIPQKTGARSRMQLAGYIMLIALEHHHPAC